MQTDETCASSPVPKSCFLGRLTLVSKRGIVAVPLGDRAYDQLPWEADLDLQLLWIKTPSDFHEKSRVFRPPVPESLLDHPTIIDESPSADRLATDAPWDFTMLAIAGFRGFC